MATEATSLLSRAAVEEKSRFLFDKVTNGPVPIRVFIGVGGVALVVVQVLNLGAILTLSRFMALRVYLALFGVLTVILEVNSAFTVKYRSFLENWMKVLSRVWGRAIFYFFVGTLTLSLWNFLDIVVGVWFIFFSIIYFFVGRSTESKLKGLRAQLRGDDQVTELFFKFDIDDDGHINPEEFAALCKELIVGITTAEIDAASKYLDENGDGVIDQDEFLRWYHMKVESNGMNGYQA